MTDTDQQTSAAPAPPLFAVLPMPNDLEDLPFPDNGPYFLIGKKRAYVHKNVHQGRVVLPVNSVDALNDPLDGKRGFFWYDEDKLKIPAWLVGQAWSFFRAIYNRRGSEAMIYITYKPDAGYRVFVPPQRASGGGVHAEFNPEHLQKGWRLVGTIHSHCDFGAFHSGTDTHDADGHDGIHMTIGKVKSNPPEIATMVSVNGVRWDFKPEQVIDGELKFTVHPRWWERYVREPEPVNKGKHISQWAKKYTGSENRAAAGGQQQPLPFAQASTVGTPTAGTSPAALPVPVTGTPGKESPKPATSSTDLPPATTAKSPGFSGPADELRMIAGLVENMGYAPPETNMTTDEFSDTLSKIADDIEDAVLTLEDWGIDTTMQFNFDPFEAENRQEFYRRWYEEYND